MRVRTERDSFGGYVVQGAAMGVGAFLGAALVTVVLAFVAKRLNFYRLRQEGPRAFRAGSLRTIHLRPGVMAVVGCPR